MPQCGFILNLRVHVYNMRFIAEHFSAFADDPVDVVDRQSIAQHVMLGDEDHIGLIQLLVAVALHGQIRIQQAAVIACPLDGCTAVAALDFDVVSPVRLIHR